MSWRESIHHILDPTSVASRVRRPGGGLDPGPWPTDPTDITFEGPGDFEAAAERPRSGSIKTRRQIQHRLSRDNYWRWRRLQHDIRWMKKRLVKMGLNPEDWRTYLDG